ncbi:hypothetical protein GGR52DRAFT_530854 [Hypoxylon sp. FL1284]|nr:hypothetical protein GGR52DRAFT_530854 [Hypoxylon sp. FL1284]
MPPIRCTQAYSSSAAAKLFVRLFRTSSLCSSSTLSPAASSCCSPILDVFLPPAARAFHVSRDLRTPTRTRSIRTRNDGRTAAAATGRRSFGTTPAWRGTQAVYNPQKDEDGNDMLLEITPRAAHRLSQIMVKDKNPDLALRISVESGGCHGFQYLMSLTSLPPSFPSGPSSSEPNHAPETSPSSPPNPASPTAAATVAPSTTTGAQPSAPAVGEDDTILAFVKDEESSNSSSSSSSNTAAAMTAEGIPKVILDGPSLELLKGSKIDFTMELIGSQFKIVDNPHASSSCGCGTSFDIKV